MKKFILHFSLAGYVPQISPPVVQVLSSPDDEFHFHASSQGLGSAGPGSEASVSSLIGSRLPSDNRSSVSRNSSRSGGSLKSLSRSPSTSKRPRSPLSDDSKSSKVLCRQEEVVVLVSCPVWIHKHLKGLKSLEFISADTKITFLKDDQIHISCLRSAQDKIVRAFQEEIDKIKADWSCVALPIDAKHRKLVIGKGGATIRRLRTDMRVTIDVPEPGSACNNVQIEGLHADVSRARLELNNIVACAPIKKTIVVPPSLHYTFIGREGREVRRIEKKFGASLRINFPELGSRGDIVYVKGPEKDVFDCVTYMNRRVRYLLDDRRRPRSPTRDLPAPNPSRRPASSSSRLHQDDFTAAVAAQVALESNKFNFSHFFK